MFLTQKRKGVFSLAEVKWIKITTDIFDDEKILMIESMPSADSIIVIWFKLLTFAGKQNNDGVFLMSNRIAYTEEMLASIFRRDVNLVRMSLKTFKQFGMIDIIDNVVTIPNWNKHQSLDAYEKKKERDRIYQAERRATQRALIEKSSDTSSDTSSDVAFSEEEKEEEIDKELDREERIDYKSIVEMYHSICKSYPTIRSLSEARKKAIRARLNTYSVDDFRTVFENAEASSFLKGRNDRNWAANFDWLIADKNFVKVLEGTYADKKDRYVRTEQVPSWMRGQPSGNLGDAEMEAIKRVLQSPQESSEQDQQFQERAEKLKTRLREKYGKGVNNNE